MTSKQPQTPCCAVLYSSVLVRYGSLPFHVWFSALRACSLPFRFGDLEAAEDFIAIGKDVNEQDRDGRTPLHYAVAHDKQDVLKALISASANLEAAENMQNTPLHYACGYGRGQCVETLIDAGANVHATNASGKTGLDLVK